MGSALVRARRAWPMHTLTNSHVWEFYSPNWRHIWFLNSLLSQYHVHLIVTCAKEFDPPNSRVYFIFFFFVISSPTRVPTKFKKMMRHVIYHVCSCLILGNSHFHLKSILIGEHTTPFNGPVKERNGLNKFPKMPFCTVAHLERAFHLEPI